MALKDDLSSEEKIKYILEFQEFGMDRKEIADRMGYAGVKQQDRFMKNQGYTKVDDKYVLKQGYAKVGGKCVLKMDDNSKAVEDNDRTMYDNCKPVEGSCHTMEDNSKVVEGIRNINVIQTNKIDLEEASKDKEDKYTISVLQSTESKQKLSNILENHSELIEMLEWFREVKAKYPTTDIPATFNIDYGKSKVVKTTIRVDEDIWNDFSTLCKTKYSHLSKVDLVSQILKNFIDENK